MNDTKLSIDFIHTHKPNPRWIRLRDWLVKKEDISAIWYGIEGANDGEAIIIYLENGKELDFTVNIRGQAYALVDYIFDLINENLEKS